MPRKKITVAPEYRRCSKCKVEKPFADFYRSKNCVMGRGYICAACGRAHGLNYAATHRAEALARAAEWYREHRERVLARQSSPENLQKRHDAKRERTPEQIIRDNKYRRDYDRRRCAEDPCYRLAFRLRKRIAIAIRQNSKTGSAVRDLGCSISDLKAHLEAGFLPGMTWENWGRRGWHIDHIAPLSSFDLTDPVQFRRAVHYTNLQPLWWFDNLSKGKRI